MGINHSSVIEPGFEVAEARDFLEISSSTEEIVRKFTSSQIKVFTVFFRHETFINTDDTVNCTNPETEYNNSQQLSIFSREADLQVPGVFNTTSKLQALAKTISEIEDKVEALHNTAESYKQYRDLIRFISRELRYIQAELYKSLVPVRVLSVSQALEVLLIACGDVEENPGPIFLDVRELAEVCNHCLVEEDVSVILKAVSPVAALYSSFLRVLGLPESQLSEIKTECRESPQECLQKGLIRLLRENYNTDDYRSLTWRRLVKAVADTAGGNNHTLARKIAAEHRELPDGSVNRDRECLKLAVASANPNTQQKYKQSGSFAVMFPKLKQNLERSLKPEDLKEFLRYFCNPASLENCLIDKHLYRDLDSTSEILDSLHPKYINPGNMFLLQEIVDNFGSRQSKTLLRNYNSQWE